MKAGVVRFLRLASAIAAGVLGVHGCQSPEVFHKNADGGVVAGGAGGRTGAGAAGFGTGGSTFGSGGSFVSTGGSSFVTGGASATGGSSFVTGGATATGGATFATGGATGSGGSTAGTGGADTGGAAAGGTSATGGAGGAGSGGAANGGAGGRGSGGAAGRGGNGGGTGVGGGTGTGPCMGLCSSPTAITVVQYNSGDLGTGATCHETVLNIQGGNCSNIGLPRTFSVNGTAVPCPGNWPSLPAKKGGGYCFQASAGGAAFGSFVTF